MDGGGGGAPPALEKNAAELTVMDVYDIASAVGQEFERVIDQHGCEAIARLMPKVVRVLEILEVLVSRNHINPEMEELRLELDRLRLERMDRIEKERKHQKVRAGAGGGDAAGQGCSRLPQSGPGESRAPAPPPPPFLPPAPPCPAQPLGKTKREAGVRAGMPRSRWGAGGARVWVRPGQAHGLCADAAVASLWVWVCCCVGFGLGFFVVFFFFPSWKFPSSFPFSTPSLVTAFPSPCVYPIRTPVLSPLLMRGYCCFLLGQERSLTIIHFSLQNCE